MTATTCSACGTEIVHNLCPHCDQPCLKKPCALTLHSKLRARERILAYGGMDAGKTTNLLHIAARCPDATFHVLDTDFAYDRMLSGQYESLHSDNGGNVHVYPVIDWEDYTSLLVKAQAQMSPDDWLSIDMLSPSWGSVQDYYSLKVFGEDKESYFLEARLAQKKGHAFDGRKDWTHINGLYRKFLVTLLARTPGHIYCTASESTVGEDDDKRLRQMFGTVGFRPNGQKETGHAFHTVIRLARTSTGREMTTVKDRERGLMSEVGVENFANQYLVKVAGWRPEMMA